VGSKCSECVGTDLLLSLSPLGSHPPSYPIIHPLDPTTRTYAGLDISKNMTNATHGGHSPYQWTTHAQTSAVFEVGQVS
jgi:hypothetical protein